MNWLAALRRGEAALDLTGKAASITYGPGRDTAVLADLRVERIGFAHFVVGRWAWRTPDEGAGRPPLTCWLSVTDIKQMWVYDDLEAARRAYGAHVESVGPVASDSPEPETGNA